MPIKSKYNLYKFAHCKIPEDQYLRIKKVHGNNWAEFVRDLVEAALFRMEENKE